MIDRRNQVSARTSTVVIGIALLAGGVVLGVNYDPSSDAPTEVPPPLNVDLVENVLEVALPPARYLAAGDKAPALAADTWVPMLPQAADAYAGQLTIIDLWGDWCPFARNLSLGLIAMRDEFKDEPVEFVSLTLGTSPSEGLEDRGWISGFADGSDLMPFRCLFQDVTYGLSVHPTIYLIGSDGYVLWCDEGMREGHAEPVDVERSVREALESALADMKSRRHDEQAGTRSNGREPAVEANVPVTLRPASTSQ